MRFAIVTPCYNPGHYLLETLQSVFTQAGDFSINYHVQDAGSTDGAVALLQSQLEQLELGNTAIQCRQLTFSYTSVKDRGMYDGLNRGFRQLLNVSDVDVMLWINADDRLAADALANIVKYFSAYPDVDWLIGRTLHLDEQSNTIVDAMPYDYRREDIANGWHDGESLPFVTQEATVWRAKLWDRCGELDTRLLYAGDFEYWMRAAKLGFVLCSADISIGYHRKRAGQLSAIGCYMDEAHLVRNIKQH